MTKTGITHKSRNQFYRRAKYLAIAAIVFFGFSFSIYWTLEGLADKIWIELTGCAISILVIIIFRRARGIWDPAFLVPFLIYASFITGSVFSGRFASFFTVYLCICGLAMSYFNFWKFLLFAIISNTITLVLILAGAIDNMSPGYTFEELLINWTFSVFGSMFMLSAIHFISEIIRKSTKAEDSFTTMLSSTPDYIVLVDELNYITYISRPLAEFAHIEDPVMAQGRPLLDIFRDIDVKLKAAEILDSHGLYEDTWELSQDGTKRYFRIISNRLLGDTIGYFISLIDITPMVMARFEAEAADRAKGAFLANTSHEIRTPMNAILGMSELILRKDIAPDVYEHVMSIRQAGTNLLTIINDVLDFSKIESGKLDIVPVEYRIDSLINDVISIIKIRLTEKRLDFITRIDGSLPSVLIGDETRVRQVLINLLTNAVKYTKEGDICLSVFSAEFSSGVETQDRIELNFEVADTGIGIHEENLSRLFGEFEQFDRLTNRGQEGTGLGLAISRNLCLLMGGDLTVKSVYGQGSVFNAVIPQGVKDLTPFASVTESETKSVIICEKNEKQAEALVYTVKQLGAPCSVAANPAELKSLLLENHYGYALVAFSMYDDVWHILESVKPALTLAVLPGINEEFALNSLCRPAWRWLPIPVQPNTLANFINGKADTPVNAYSGFDSHLSGARYSYYTVNFIIPKTRLLVVDDIVTNLKVAEGLLSPYRATVDTCLSGGEAIELIKQHDYDIVFMNHMMPDMDGLEAVRIIREFETKHIPIIALTANAVSGMREMYLEKGFDDFLPKPIEVSRLDEMLARWIAKEKREKGKEKREIRKEKREKEEGENPMSESSFPFPDLSLEAIPGVDVWRGVVMTGGTEAGYRAVLSAFIKDAEIRLPLLQAVPAVPDLPAFITHVHALKSASASIGAAEVSSEAAALEAAGKASDLALVGEKLQGFMRHLAELVSNIQIAINAGAEAAAAQAVSDSEYLSFFGDLIKALQAKKIQEIERLLEELGAKPPDLKARKILDQVSDHVLLAEYDSAVKSIYEQVSKL